MFDDGKYMAKEAVDRNNALAALDQQRSEDTVRAWSRNVAVRRGVSVLLALVHVAITIMTGLSEPRVFVTFVLVWIAVLALTRTALRSNKPAPVGRGEGALWPRGLSGRWRRGDLRELPWKVRNRSRSLAG